MLRCSHASFHTYIFDQRGNVKGQMDFRAKDDEAAIRVADSMDIGKLDHGYCLWQGGRRVKATAHKGLPTPVFV